MQARSWQDLRWVMALNAYVALVAIAVRSVAGPAATEGTSLRWAGLTLALAATLFLPAGRAVGAVIFPRDNPDERCCPLCSRPELRPIRAGGRGLFDPTHRYRCGACWTSFDLEDRALIERVDPIPAGSAGPAGIWFVEPIGIGPGESGIEFLGEVGPMPRTPATGTCHQGQGAISSGPRLGETSGR